MMDAFSPYMFGFFALIVAFGGFFIVNLFLAVIVNEVIEAQAAEKEEAALQKTRDASAAYAADALAANAAAMHAERDAAEGDDVEGGALLAAGAARSDDGPDQPSAKTPSPLKREKSTACLSAMGKVYNASRPEMVAAAKKRPSVAHRGCCDCHPAPTGCRRWLHDLVLSNAFGHGSTGLVIVNMILMCCPYATQTDEYAAGLEQLATIITVIFMVEMNLKLVGLGCKGYWSDGWNQLDGCIVIMSYFDLGMTLVASGGGANLSFLRILRMLRVLRMLRLLKSWKGLYKVCMTVVKSLPQISNVLVLFFLIVIIFALLGMQLFGGQFTPAVGYQRDDLPRQNFDYFGPAMISVFDVMSGKWFEVTKHCVNATGGGATAEQRREMLEFDGVSEPRLVGRYPDKLPVW